MPTFMIFRAGKPINTIKGADPRALTDAVEAAIKFAPTSKPLYSTPGRTLGGPGIKPAQSLSRPASASVQEFFTALIAFFGLYFITLFSVSGALHVWLRGIADWMVQFDSYAAGENSQFNIHRMPPPRTTTSATGGAKAAAPPVRKVGTISGLTGES
jgi:thioredoxin 1